MLFVSSTLLFSCKKDSGSSNNTCSLSSSAIVGTYKIIAATYQATATSAPTNDYATWDACEKDDLITINSNNTYQFSDGALVCNPSGAETGTWFLNGSVLVINTNGSTNSYSQTITEFNCTTFKLTNIYDATTGENEVLTLQRQ